ncbi:hypothetical protein ACJJIF_01360 [Microbulbifer sp. SSSA002]|uniref:hypothetical protein n=1 Tax=Microbulbifer sp. SSSA002 TaxID=3243376 RepID=UPI004039598B
MLKFKESESEARILALHYARKMDDQLLVDFVMSKIQIDSIEMASSLTKSFWQMTELAIKDSGENKVIEGISDIEFWMYKLFNKISGYMFIHGFEEIWESASSKD